MGGEAKVRLALAAQTIESPEDRRRAQAIQAFKHAIDALFEAESAERAIPPVKELFAIAHRPSLRLATLHGRVLSPGLALGHAGAGLSTPTLRAFPRLPGKAGPRGEACHAEAAPARLVISR
ncbi:MAG: hypothetical protein ACLQME_23715 [Alphaproteobacteria bacterium]